MGRSGTNGHNESLIKASTTHSPNLLSLECKINGHFLTTTEDWATSIDTGIHPRSLCLVFIHTVVNYKI